MIGFNKSLVRILVVDDEESIRTVLATSLKDDGWNVEMAANGKLGLEAHTKTPFHVVVSDIQMPEMTGIELLGEVKKKNVNTEFIVMTSNATLESAVQAVKLGAYDYLSKPFEDLSVVSKKLEQVSEKILLRQQNNELIKRLKKATLDLKNLFQMASELNGILDEGNLQKAAVTWPAKVFQDPNVGCFWFRGGDKWKIVQQVSSTPLSENQEFANPEEIKAALPQLKSPREILLKHDGAADQLVVFEAPSNDLADILSHELKTCFQKVMQHQDVVSLANRDGLTRLYNHRYFQDRLRQEVSQVKRQNGDLSIILIDVDFFKKFNDAHGHPAGDQLLRELAVLFDTECKRRDSDIVARYGGEEFVFILPFTDHAGAMIKADRIREAVQNHVFGTPEQPLEKITISLGIASFPQHAISPSVLVEFADKALYRSKEKGRNCSTGYDEFKTSASQSSAPRTTLGSVLSDLETAPLPPVVVEEMPGVADVIEAPIAAAPVVIEEPALAPVEVVPPVVATPAPAPVPEPVPEKPRLRKKALGPSVDIDDLCSSIESVMDQPAKTDADIKAVVFKTVDEIKTKEEKNGTGTQG